MNFNLNSVRLLRTAQKVQVWGHNKNFTKINLLTSKTVEITQVSGIRSISINCVNYAGLVQNEVASLGLSQKDLASFGLNQTELASLGVNPSVTELDLSDQIPSDNLTDPSVVTQADGELLSDSTELMSDSAELVNITSLAEPSFTSMGLGHGWPSGWLQTLMEIFHIDIGLPWWQTIGITTICLRILIFPIMVISQKNMIRMNNHQPEIQKLQIQSQLASMRGNVDEAHFTNKCLNNYYHANGCHPAKAMWPILAQSGCFMSMFFAIRGMANVPVPSLTSGGLFWFTDLTLADPTMILPIVTCSTIYLQIYLGADGMNTSTMPDFMKKLLYIMPLISVPIMIQFPTALNCYWFSNNVISLLQARLVRNPEFRNKMGFEKQIIWKPEELPITTFQEQMKQEQARQGRLKKEEITRKRESEERMKEKMQTKIRDRVDEARKVKTESDKRIQLGVSEAIKVEKIADTKEKLSK